MLILDLILFVLFAICVVYLFVFAVASVFPEASSLCKAPKNKNGATENTRNFLILIPAYKEEGVIIESVKACIAQSYPNTAFKTVVIADHFREESLAKLRKENIYLIDVAFEDSSKAKSLRYAIENKDIYSDFKPDAVVILDADNLIPSSFLMDVNSFLQANPGTAIQTHRQSKNTDTAVAILDSASEEMNNSIFRKGHIRLGLPSALIGSGMIFDFSWFKSHVSQLETAGEDKELELMLLREKIFINYCNNIIVLDEKTKKSSAFYNQRRRWISAQIHSFSQGIKDIIPAIAKGNIAYVDKILQWVFPPRLVLIGLIFILALAISFYDFSIAIKWWVLFGVLILALCLALPSKFWKSKAFYKSVVKIPWLFILMFANFFRVRGAVYTFIHTQHGNDNENSN